MQKKKIIIAFIFLTTPHLTQAWTLVYYAVHRRLPWLTKENPTNEKPTISLAIIPALDFIKRHIAKESREHLLPIDTHEESFLAGPIFAFKYVGEKPWWFDIRTAVIDEKVAYTGTHNFTAQRTAFDDIFAQGGYNFAVTNKLQICVLGALGIPTAIKIRPEELFNTLAGIRTFSVAAGSEISYAFINEPNYELSLNLQARLFHFFTRPFTPVLPCGDLLKFGEALDFLLSVVYSKEGHYLEIDYNPTLYINHAVVSNGKKDYGPVALQHSPYIQYYYTFNLPKEHSLTIGGGIQYSYIKVDTFRELQMWWLVGTTF